MTVMHNLEPFTDEAMTTPQDALPPSAMLIQLITGQCVAQCISAAAHLGLADRMKGGPQAAEELARSCGAHAPSVYRLCRALANAGVFEEHDGKRFSLTPMGECLRTDIPGSLAGTAKMFGEGWHSAAWAELLHTVRTGEPAFPKAYGEGLFEWLGTHREEAEIFNDAMTSFSSTTAAAVVDAYDFSSFTRLADIGGGHGFLLASILEANPRLRGVLFDLPQVVHGAKDFLTKRGVEQRCEVVGGDCFKTVPGGCDAYVMKHVIHDWSDEACTTLLRLCAEGLAPDGRILVVEHVIPPHGVPSLAKIIDVEMLVMTHGGYERTEAEFAELFGRAGLRLSRVVPTESPVAVLEAVRA